jgi:hypothetical protein
MRHVLTAMLPTFLPCSHTIRPWFQCFPSLGGIVVLGDRALWAIGLAEAAVVAAITMTTGKKELIVRFLYR